MKSKAPLALMEQLVMVLVFALAAALCVQAFFASDRMSRQGEARDRAVLLADSGIANAARYRCKAVPAAGALVKEEDSGNKQIEFAL